MPPHFLIVADAKDAEMLTDVVRSRGASCETKLVNEWGTDCEKSPDGVVVAECENLEPLVSDLRQRFGQVPVVYIADTEGVFRTPLDVSSKGVDAFINRPVSANALFFALGQSGVAKLDGLVESAIDEFVTDAIASLGEQGMEAAIQEPVEAPAPEPRESTFVLKAKNSVMSEAVSPQSLEIDLTGEESVGQRVRDQMKRVSQNLFPNRPPTIDTGVSYSADIDLGLTLPSEEPEIEERLGGVAMSGTIVRGKSDAAAILAQVALANLTCKVRFIRDDVRKVVTCVNGVPTFAMSTLPHDRLGDLLYREGKINQEQNDVCRSKSVEQGMRFGEVMVSRNLITQAELLPAIRRHVEEIIYSVFSWGRGKYEIEDSPGSEESVVIEKHPLALIIEGVNRKLNTEEASNFVGEEDLFIAIRTPDRYEELIRVASLNSQQREALGLIRAGKPRSVILEETGIAKGSFDRLVYGICVLGIGAIQDAHSFDSTRLAEIEEQQIKEKLLHIYDGDYFAVLGVEAGASTADIDLALQRSLRRFSPAQFESSVRETFKDELQEIQEVTVEAHSVLTDVELAKKYRENLD